MHPRGRRTSNYGTALSEKQKIKYYYGLGERQLRLGALIWLLLAQRLQARMRFRARYVGINDDIVVVAVRREKAVNAMSRE